MGLATATITMTMHEAARLKTIRPWWNRMVRASARRMLGLRRCQLERLIQPCAAEEVGLPMTAFRRSWRPL
jgi:hypothetical protein